MGRSRRLRVGAGTDAQWVGEVLGEWRSPELRIARSFAECRGLSREQLEDIYSESTLALLRRPYQSEEHLRNALRTAIKHRALNHHRDERTRARILAECAPGMHMMAEASAGEDAPEMAALVRQDRLIVSEFLTELDAAEQRVFWLLAEGMQYRAIAPTLGIEVNAARNASRAVERKRERFQLLYDTGRLCGFRSATILALQGGKATSEELAERAFAHLNRCTHCRTEYKTNARRLRHSFQGQADALLPFPVLVVHLSWGARLDLRFRSLLGRLLPDGAPVGSGALRERAIATIAGGGAAAKAAATVATVVVVGGTIGATHVLDHGSGTHHDRAKPRSATVQRASAVPSPVTAPPIIKEATSTERRTTSSAHPRRASSSRGSSSSGKPPSAGERTRLREPGGFAYLGVPHPTPRSVSSASAHIATRASGGQFSP